MYCHRRVCKLVRVRVCVRVCVCVCVCVCVRESEYVCECMCVYAFFVTVFSVFKRNTEMPQRSTRKSEISNEITPASKKTPKMLIFFWCCVTLRKCQNIEKKCARSARTEFPQWRAAKHKKWHVKNTLDKILLVKKNKQMLGFWRINWVFCNSAIAEKINTHYQFSIKTLLSNHGHATVMFREVVTVNRSSTVTVQLVVYSQPPSQT